MVVFDRYAIDLAQFSPSTDGAPLKPRERSTLDLLNPNLEDPYVKANFGSLRAELHDRFVNPIYALVFGMIGFAAAGRVRTTRQSRGLMIVGAVLAALLVRMAGVGASSMAASGPSGVFVQYLIPIVAFVAAAWQGFGDPVRFFGDLARRGGLRATAGAA